MKFVNEEPKGREKQMKKENVQVNTLGSKLTNNSIQWHGHVLRMSKDRIPKTRLNTKLEGKHEKAEIETGATSLRRCHAGSSKNTGIMEEVWIEKDRRTDLVGTCFTKWRHLREKGSNTKPSLSLFPFKISDKQDILFRQVASIGHLYLESMGVCYCWRRHFVSQEDLLTQKHGGNSYCECRIGLSERKGSNDCTGNNLLQF
jgi:hypothetical protein